MPGQQTIPLFCCLLRKGSSVKSMKMSNSVGVLVELQAIDSKFSTPFLHKSTD